MENSNLEKHRNWILTSIDLTQDTISFDNLMKVVCVNGSPNNTLQLRRYVKQLQGEIKINQLIGINHKYTPEKVELAKKRYAVLNTLALLNPTESKWPKWNVDADL